MTGYLPFTNEKVEILLVFRKKTRAHKWRNYTVYGLLTLSQLSKTGFITKKKVSVKTLPSSFRNIDL